MARGPEERRDLPRYWDPLDFMPEFPDSLPRSMRLDDSWLLDAAGPRGPAAAAITAAAAGGGDRHGVHDAGAAAAATAAGDAWDVRVLHADAAATAEAFVPVAAAAEVAAEPAVVEPVVEATGGNDRRVRGQAGELADVVLQRAPEVVDGGYISSDTE